MPRIVELLELAPDERVLAALPVLARALDGAGPAVLPVSAGAAIAPGSLVGRPVGDDIAAVVTTSGSTGRPRGVMLPARALRASVAATQQRIGGPGQWLLAVPPQSIAGLQVLVRSVLGGTEPRVLDLSRPFGPKRFTAATASLTEQQCFVSLVPTQLLRLLEDPDATAALATYSAVLVGGAPTAPALVERARASQVRVLTTYGMTETCGGCVYDGRPLAGVELATTSTGTLRIRSPVLAQGYLGDVAATAAAFDNGWFLTSDLGHVADDGTVTVSGRADDLIVTGGVNVAPAAVEAALLEHRGVASAAVFGRTDGVWGQRVVAVVVPRHEAPTHAALRAHVADRAGRAAAPRELVVVAALPTLPAGKVDRLALRTLRGEVWEG